MNCFWEMFVKIILAFIVLIIYAALTAGIGIYIGNKINANYPPIIGLTIMILGIIAFVCAVECGLIHFN